MKSITAADLFCGAGGTSAGLVDACDEIGLNVELTAINHWDIAVATHTAMKFLDWPNSTSTVGDWCGLRSR